MDYASLTGNKTTPGSIVSWLNNTTLLSAAPEIISDAESWIYRRLRHWRMLTVPTPGTMTVGDDFVSIPSDMLEPYLIWLTGNDQQFLPQRTPQEVISCWGYDDAGNRVAATPVMYYFDQAALRFDSVADKAYPYNLIYFQQPAPLAATGTNWLTQFYPRLMRCAVMAAATEYAKDSGVGSYDRTYWDQMVMVEIDAAQTESDRAKRATASAAVIGGDNAYDRGPWL